MSRAVSSGAVRGDAAFWLRFARDHVDRVGRKGVFRMMDSIRHVKSISSWYLVTIVACSFVACHSEQAKISSQRWAEVRGTLPQQCDFHGQAMLSAEQMRFNANESVRRIVTSFADGPQEFWDPISCVPSSAMFDSANMRESGKSNTSGTIVRQRAFVSALLTLFDTVSKADGTHMCLDVRALHGKRIYNTESHGIMHAHFVKTGVNYTASEFLGPDKTPGSMHDHKSFGRIRHEDLTNLSFEANAFDIVMSAEVLEHVPDPYMAHKEIFRVLKPGGTHVFTVPMNDNPSSADDDLATLDNRGRLWFRAGPDGQPIPPQLHGDPLSPSGVKAETGVGQVRVQGEQLLNMGSPNAGARMHRKRGEELLWRRSIGLKAQKQRGGLGPQCKWFFYG